MKPNFTRPLLEALLGVVCVGQLHGTSTLVSHQGFLRDNGQPANGLYDFTFALLTNATGGTAIAGPVTNAAVPVTNGVYVAFFDFGPDAYGFEDIWLQIGVGTNGGPVTQISPPHYISSGARAVYALNSDSLGGLAPSNYATAGHTHDAAEITVGTMDPGHGGLGLDSSAAAPGSMLSTPASGTWALLPPGAEGQVLKIASGLPYWGTDESGAGTVTSVQSGTGLVGGPITGSGTLSVDSNVIPLLTISNLFVVPQSFEGGLRFGDIYLSSTNLSDPGVSTQAVAFFRPEGAPIRARVSLSFKERIDEEELGQSRSEVRIDAENSTPSQRGTSLSLSAADGAGTNANGGDLFLTPGLGTGSGTSGVVHVESDLVVTGGVFSSAFSGDGSGLLSLSASNLAPGVAAIDITGNAFTATTASNAMNLGGASPTAFARVDTTNAFSSLQVFTNGIRIGTVDIIDLSSNLVYIFDAVDPDTSMSVGVYEEDHPQIRYEPSEGVSVQWQGGAGVGTNNGGDILLIPGVALGSGTNGSVRLGGDLVLTNDLKLGGTRLAGLTNGLLIEPELVQIRLIADTSGSNSAVSIGPVTSGTNVTGAGFKLLGGDGVGTNQSGGDIWILPGLGTGSGTNGQVFLGGDLVVTGGVTFGSVSLTNFARLDGTNVFIGSNAFPGVSFTPGSVKFEGQPVNFAGTEANFLASTFNVVNGSSMNFQATNGNPPFSVTSTTRVDNLNAEYLSGFDANAFPRLDTTNTYGSLQIFTNGARFGAVDLAGVYSNIVLRSSTFAIWVTVGFFEVDQNTDGAKLQAVPSATNRNGSQFTLAAGDATGPNLNGGDLLIQPGMGTGSGTNGLVRVSGDLALESGALSVAGGVTLGTSASNPLTLAGSLQGSSPLILDGSTSDANHTTLSVTEPTSANTITLQDASGTVVLAGADVTLGNPTPSVSGRTVLALDGNTGPLQITDLADGFDGQVVVLIGGVNPVPPTIQDDNSFPPGNFRLQGADWVADENDTLTLARYGGVWFETARSSN